MAPWLPLTLLCLVFLSTACSDKSTLPTALSDPELWSLMETLSEPAGAFTLSENLVSNEPRFAENIRWLRGTGGVYIGVGPEQNFSYIARLRPTMAFVVDIRRDNRNLHLLYKVLFELSTDRADFVSRLFSRPRPSALGADASVEEIFRRFAAVAPSPAQHSATAALVRDRLTQRSGARLSSPDLDAIARAHTAFYTDGPEIQFWGARVVHPNTLRPSYRQLMTTADSTGQSRSFLATQESFNFVKDLHSRNLIVPLVGDFGGPSTIRRIGDYTREHLDEVTAFYGSNVAVYLNAGQTKAFCDNLADLPVTSRAWFIENDEVRSISAKLRSCRDLITP